MDRNIVIGIDLSMRLRLNSRKSCVLTNYNLGSWLARMSNFLTLHKKKPREKSGSKTSSRFEFQANYSILKILDLHEGGDDYRAFFDHFDDLTILDSSNSPTRIEFFQIKGRDAAKHWTIKQLVKKEKKGTPPTSIIGKMYKNAVDFSDDVNHITFVSNASFKVTLADGTMTTTDDVSISGSDLHASEIHLIDATLETDFPSPRNPVCKGILFLERTNLPLQEQATFVTGRLVELLEKYAEQESFPIKALYDVLFQNVMTRAGNTQQSTSLDELHQNKSLSRLEISALFEKAATKRSFQESWTLIAQELTAGNYSTVKMIRVQNAALRYLRERGRGDKRPNEFSGRLKAIVTAEKLALRSLDSILDVTEFLRAKSAGAHTYTGDELLGALLIEAYEAIENEE